MSRFRSELNISEIREFFEPSSDFSRRHPLARQMLGELGQFNFHICEVTEHNHHTWIRLGCGAILSVYQSGKVLVQGRVQDADSETMLKEILHGRSVAWQLKV